MSSSVTHDVVKPLRSELRRAGWRLDSAANAPCGVLNARDLAVGPTGQRSVIRRNLAKTVTVE